MLFSDMRSVTANAILGDVKCSGKCYIGRCGSVVANAVERKKRGGDCSLGGDVECRGVRYWVTYGTQ